MSLQVPAPDTVSTATTYIPARPESVTLVVDKETARFLTRVQTLRNQVKRGDGPQPYALVNLDDLTVGVVITFK